MLPSPSALTAMHLPAHLPAGREGSLSPADMSTRCATSGAKVFVCYKVEIAEGAAGDRLPDQSLSKNVKPVFNGHPGWREIPALGGRSGPLA